MRNCLPLVDIPVGMSGGGDCLNYAHCYGKSQPTVSNAALQAGVLRCVRVEESSWEQESK